MSRQGVEPEPGDVSIFDDGGALTREFLLDRGYCCQRGCRNCPYGFRAPASPPTLPASVYGSLFTKPSPED